MRRWSSEPASGRAGRSPRRRLRRRGRGARRGRPPMVGQQGHPLAGAGHRLGLRRPDPALAQGLRDLHLRHRGQDRAADRHGRRPGRHRRRHRGPGLAAAYAGSDRRGRAGGRRGDRGRHPAARLGARHPAGDRRRVRRDGRALRPARPGRPAGHRGLQGARPAVLPARRPDHRWALGGRRHGRPVARQGRAQRAGQRRRRATAGAGRTRSRACPPAPTCTCRA